ncbi:MAG: DUF4215 domain-containing protein [Myxococcota bacterium]
MRYVVLGVTVCVLSCGDLDTVQLEDVPLTDPAALAVDVDGGVPAVGSIGRESLIRPDSAPCPNETPFAIGFRLAFAGPGFEGYQLVCSAAELNDARDRLIRVGEPVPGPFARSEGETEILCPADRFVTRFSGAESDTGPAIRAVGVYCRPILFDPGREGGFFYSSDFDDQERLAGSDGTAPPDSDIDSACESGRVVTDVRVEFDLFSIGPAVFGRLSAQCAQPSVPATCGDGIVDPGTEVCDDGNTTSGDGCSAACDAVTPGFFCADGLSCDVCTPCGSDQFETSSCDSFGDSSCEPCDPSCTACDGEGPSQCTACGDGAALEDGVCTQDGGDDSPTDPDGDGDGEDDGAEGPGASDGDGDGLPEPIGGSTGEDDSSSEDGGCSALPLPFLPGLLLVWIGLRARAYRRLSW